MRGASALTACFGFFAIASIGQLLWVATWKPGPQYRHAEWESTAQPPREHAKLVWIVFDELSHDQVFEHRAHDLNLPAFDALRRQSTLYTDVQPAGIKTVKVIPSLLTGHEVDNFRFSFANRLRVHDVDRSGWHPLTGDDTVFADARKAGFRTAAVGWYNPYCTIYASAIDNCYWQNLDKFDGPMVEGDPLWRNTLEPLRQVVREAKSPVRAERDNCTADVRQRFKTNVDLKAHAQRLLRTDQADFVFLHFALPHSPNIWSRATDSYTQFCDSSYLDNLALTDRELGQMMAILEASPRWKDTTVIVQGDHSWRTEIWQNEPTWTDEDDEISRRGFDTRPALLIHRPGQTQPETDSSRWPLIRIHDVLEHMLQTASPTNP
jgi:arylsulfatase A-like enzyme